MRRGAVAQLGECLTGSQEVASSILASSTNKIKNLQQFPIILEACPLESLKSMVSGRTEFWQWNRFPNMSTGIKGTS
jgi:hypothetical protein